MTDQLLESFESFLVSAIFEDSNLSQLGLPKAMIRTIHTKEEHHSKEYPKMGHTYRGGSAIPMPYEYYVPSSNIEIPEPIKLRGRKSSSSPFHDKSIRGEYTDFAWYLQSIPFDRDSGTPLRILIMNKELDFYILLYHKRRSSGASGEQYAVMSWEPNYTSYEISKPTMTLGKLSEKFSLPIASLLDENPEIKRTAELWLNQQEKKDKDLSKFNLHRGEILRLPPRTIDYGYSELTTSGVDLDRLRDVHDEKGGNTNGKIQEFVRAMTRQGGKKYAPSLEKPLYIYNFGVTPSAEPRTTREKRESSKADTYSLDFMKVFVNRFKNIITKANPQMIEKLRQSAESIIWKWSQVTEIIPGINEIAEVLQVDPKKIQYSLFDKFKYFRKELFEEGRARTQGGESAYDTTSGFELRKENQASPYVGGGIGYDIRFEKYYPDQEGPDPDTGARSAQDEKYARDLPTAGEYASIPSMIKIHTLDGVIDKFMAFLFTGKIKTPNVSTSGIFGLKGSDTNKFKKSSRDTASGKSGEPKEGDLLF